MPLVFISQDDTIRVLVKKRSLKMLDINNLRGYGLVLMGIDYTTKEELLADMNEWAKDVGFFCSEGKFTDFEKIYNHTNERTDILVKHTGTVNPIKRLEYSTMGWKWLEDYKNEYVEENEENEENE